VPVLQPAFERRNVEAESEPQLIRQHGVGVDAAPHRLLRATDGREWGGDSKKRQNLALVIVTTSYYLPINSRKARHLGGKHMGDLFGALIAFLVLLLIAPIVILAVVVGLGFAALGVAIGLAFTILGIAIELLVWAAPFLLVFGLIYWIFRPSPKRGLARQ
jgi:hypothetical protein